MKFVSLGLLSLVASAAAFTNRASNKIHRGEALFHAPKNAPKHDVQGADAFDSLSPEQKERVGAFMEHQNSVPKPGFPVDVRSLVQYNHGFAVMSTFSKTNEGYPGGSVVGFAPDEEGRPLFVFSGMSSHTQDILANPKASLTIAAKEFKGAADGRVNLMGTCRRIRNHEEIAKAKEIYRAKHPGAFWIDFGDFNWFTMDVEHIRFVGGFARAGSITAEEYTAAKPDPIMAFGGHVAQHMNDDHMDSTIAMVEHYIPGLVGDDYVKAAEITSVDSLGMYVKVTRDPENDERLPGQPQQFKLRLPFPRPATDRKDVKNVIVEMTQASSKAKQEAE
ncbi:unnamed protein product [Cylindrotheca closterium]|uniref:DUF2470 domain-containing protein n=1 Tax=Cylindrotheca closterium TaxID=2856 RepID=A0AAD2D1B4_9STRA|nr:unnamed protein product [Cylindrotheca closterium]